jgi:hypothetical protein
MTTPLTRAAVEKQLAYWRSSPGRSPTFTDFEPVAAALLAAWDERDAVQKEFDAVVAMLSEMHGAEYSRAEAAEVKLAEYSDARDRQFNLICMLHAKLAERDAEIARLRDAATAWQAFKDAHTVTDHWASVDRLDRALLNKEPTP